jgi:UDP-hydrolysing UDP-N-acetyl-D-glucosamine 2-epimerase
MRKVCVVITARPSYSRIRTALDAIAAHPELQLQLVVASSALLDRYGDAVAQIESDGFRPDAHVYTLIEGENPTTMAKSTGLGLLELASVFDQLRPDVVVTVADRFETMATAVAASYMNIPLAHVQGGEITGSIDEKVRHAVTKLADLHLVSTEQAGEHVVRMGELADAVHVTGCPSIDLAAEVVLQAERTPGLPFDPMARYGGVGPALDLSGEFLVVLQHPVTTEHELARAHVLETLHAVHELDVPTLWFWPNPDAGTDGTSNGIRSFREREQPARLHFFKNMAPTDFLHLLLASRGLVGNSSVGIRECSYLGVPTVNIGTRQDGRERGANVIDVGYERAAIAAATATQIGIGRTPTDALYGDGKAGERIADVLAGAELRTTKKLAY